MTRDRSPVRYLPWFIRDYAIWPFGLFVGVSAVVGIVFWRLVVSFGADAAKQAPVAPAVQVGTWNTWLTIAVLFATSVVIGSDIQRGYYRTWFSKPMPIWWFYLQRFLLGAITVLVAPYALGLALKLTLTSGFGIDGHLMATIALGYLMVGSATVLFSIFTQRGWLVVWLLTILQGIFGGLLRAMGNGKLQLPWFVIWLHRLLPPFDLVDARTPPLHGQDLTHVLVYGGAMVLAAFAVLVWRPMGSGGRA
jgi:hypothetical protein